MKAENAIEVKDVTKSFKVFVDKGNTIKERTLFRNRRKFDYRQVLKGISFEVKRGEAIGLIGHNGCGKSTTLKLLTKIIYPDEGSIEIKGRVSSLIELGAGFHPDLSGRENIYINASIFGLGKKEIDSRLDDIIAFSELEEFIDNPVRTYSSGMYMRLAFSVAINVDADVLLIDEILAVGDANFQAKCFNKLREIKAKGTTIVIVSHSLGQIEQICERSIWIHEGLIKEEGSPREVHPIYLDFMGQKRQEIAEREAQRQAAKEEQAMQEAQKAQEEQLAREKQLAQEAQNMQEEQLASEAQNAQEEQAAQEAQNVQEAEALAPADANVQAVENEEPEATESVPREAPKRWGNGKARITRIELLDKDGKNRTVFETGADITVRLHYKILKKVEDAVIGIGIFRSDGIQCYGTNTRLDKLPYYDLETSGVAELCLKNVMLMPGVYTLDFAIESELGIPVDYFREAVRIEFYSKLEDVGLVRVEHEWKI